MATLICWSGLHGQPATSRPSVVLELYKKLEGPASIVLAAGDVGELGHQHPVLAGEKGVDGACRALPAQAVLPLLRSPDPGRRHLYQRPHSLNAVQSRVAMEVMRAGSAVGEFQALQHASTMAS